MQQRSSRTPSGSWALLCFLALSMAVLVSANAASAQQPASAPLDAETVKALLQRMQDLEGQVQTLKSQVQTLTPAAQAQITVPVSPADASETATPANARALAAAALEALDGPQRVHYDRIFERAGPGHRADSAGLAGREWETGGLVPPTSRPSCRRLRTGMRPEVGSPIAFP